MSCVVSCIGVCTQVWQSCANIHISSAKSPPVPAPPTPKSNCLNPYVDYCARSCCNATATCDRQGRSPQHLRCVAPPPRRAQSKHAARGVRLACGGGSGGSAGHGGRSSRRSRRLQGEDHNSQSHHFTSMCFLLFALNLRLRMSPPWIYSKIFAAEQLKKSNRELPRTTISLESLCTNIFHRLGLNH